MERELVVLRAERVEQVTSRGLAERRADALAADLSAGAAGLLAGRARGSEETAWSRCHNHI